MGKILILKETNFQNNALDIDNMGGQQDLTSQVIWIGILGGSTTDYFVGAEAAVGNAVGDKFIASGTGLSYERSAGVLDVSDYIGRTIRLTIGQNTNSSDPNFKYCAFINGDYDDPQAIMVSKFNNWDGGPLTTLHTIEVVVPQGSTYLCFSHAQDTVSPFNGSVILLAQ